MTPEGTKTDTQAASKTAVGASTKAKKRHTPIERFPLRFHCAITIAMGDSLKRLTGGNSLLSESDIGRLALHSYLLANDSQYARAMEIGNGHA
jgi:hypothetical protein